MNRILIIEDEEMIRKQLIKLLERNHYTVSGVATIEEAIVSLIFAYPEHPGRIFYIRSDMLRSLS